MWRDTERSASQQHFLDLCALLGHYPIGTLCIAGNVASIVDVLTVTPSPPP